MGVASVKSQEYNVDRLMKKLDKKYNKKRQINEKLLGKPRKTWHRIMTIVMDIVFGALVIFSGLFCFNILNNRAQGTPASFFGYSAMRVVSGSMMPTYKIGDAIMVHSVDTHTLKVGDSIAFYVNGESARQYSSKVLKSVSNDNVETQYTTNFMQMFGIQSSEIRTAALTGCTLVFHKIVAIEEDENGTWWFTTKGTNNKSADNWHIEEKYVVGSIVDGGVATWFAGVLNSTSSSWMFLILLMIPIVLLAAMLIYESMVDAQIVKLELDCIEEKRRITDPICVKNRVGLHMDSRSKFKVLAQAPIGEETRYANLLWGADKVPEVVSTYFVGERVLLMPLEKLRDINRECDRMLREGAPIKNVSEFYIRARKTIDNDLNDTYKYLKKSTKKSKSDLYPISDELLKREEEK